MMSSFHYESGMLMMSVLLFRLKRLKGIEGSIQFTVEIENDGVLPFLDVNIYRGSDGSLNTPVYRKYTHTDQYT